MMLVWLHVAMWVVIFSVLWGASLALVVLVTTWIALDVLSVPGQVRVRVRVRVSVRVTVELIPN